jgi:hypothetical protein
MRFKKALLIWVQKFIYGWLIFCLGGIGSLTYFDGFLPGHTDGQHPYHLSILEEGHHSHDHGHDSLLPPSESETLTQQMMWLVSRFRIDLDFIIAQQHLAPGLAQFFASGLNDGYLLTIARPHLFNDTSLFGSVVRPILRGCSALPPPPEKPPQLNLA